MRPWRTCAAVIQVSVGGRIRGEPGAARAFCGIDYSLLSRCTSRVKSAPLSATTSTPSILFYLPFLSQPTIPFSSLLFYLLSHFHALSLLPAPVLRFPFHFPQLPAPSLVAGIFLSPRAVSPVHNPAEQCRRMVIVYYVRARSQR